MRSLALEQFVKNTDKVDSGVELLPWAASVGINMLKLSGRCRCFFSLDLSIWNKNIVDWLAVTELPDELDSL